MKQKEAKTLIVQEWERWLQTQSIDPDHASGRDTLKFYFELQDHKSALQELLQSRDLPLPEYRLVGTLEPLWNLFDLTRAGRGDDWDEQLTYACTCHRSPDAGADVRK